MKTSAQLTFAAQIVCVGAFSLTAQASTPFDTVKTRLEITVY
jgi:hypothetical protein